MYMIILCFENVDLDTLLWIQIVNSDRYGCFFLKIKCSFYFLTKTFIVILNTMQNSRLLFMINVKLGQCSHKDTKKIIF